MLVRPETARGPRAPYFQVERPFCPLKKPPHSLPLLRHLYQRLTTRIQLPGLMGPCGLCHRPPAPTFSEPPIPIVAFSLCLCLAHMHFLRALFSPCSIRVTPFFDSYRLASLGTSLIISAPDDPCHICILAAPSSDSPHGPLGQTALYAVVERCLSQRWGVRVFFCDWGGRPLAQCAAHGFVVGLRVQGQCLLPPVALYAPPRLSSPVPLLDGVSLYPLYR